MADTLLASDKIREYAELLRLTDAPDLRIWLASSEAEFCEAVEDSLHRAIIEMESGRKYYMELPEPALSKMLCSLMKSARIPTTAEEDSSGHVDVTVKHDNGIYRVLGECKIYRNYSYHLGGCRQLLKRYSAGRSKRTFCLEFWQWAGLPNGPRKLPISARTLTACTCVVMDPRPHERNRRV